MNIYAFVLHECFTGLITSPERVHCLLTCHVTLSESDYNLYLSDVESWELISEN